MRNKRKYIVCTNKDVNWDMFTDRVRKRKNVDWVEPSCIVVKFNNRRRSESCFRNPVYCDEWTTDLYPVSFYFTERQSAWTICQKLHMNITTVYLNFCLVVMFLYESWKYYTCTWLRFKSFNHSWCRNNSFISNRSTMFYNISTCLRVWLSDMFDIPICPLVRQYSGWFVNGVCWTLILKT